MSAGEAGGRDKSAFSAFVDAVCEKVRFTPARKEIAAELRAHLEDRAEMLIEHGVPPEDAARRAVAAMGNPAEIGAALDKEHAPFWGWTAELTGTFIGLVIALFLAVGMCCIFDDDGNLDTLFFFKETTNYGTADQLAGSVQVGKWYETEYGWVYLNRVDIYAWAHEGSSELVFDFDQLYIRRNPRDRQHARIIFTPLRVYDQAGEYQDGWLYRGTPSRTLYLVFGDPDAPIYTTQVELDQDVIQQVRMDSLQR